MSIFDRNVQFESRPVGTGSTGLPDSPELERQIAAEMDEAFGYDVPPTDDDLDAMYDEYRHTRGHAAAPAGFVDVPCRNCGAAVFIAKGVPPLCARCGRAADAPTPDEAFPMPGTRGWVELVASGLDDSTLLFYVGQPERTTLGVPADLILDVYSAEIVRRLERQGVAFAA